MAFIVSWNVTVYTLYLQVKNNRDIQQTIEKYNVTVKHADIK